MPGSYYISIFGLQSCHGGGHAGSPLTDNLRSDGVSPPVLSVALPVPGLDGGHGLQLTDGRLYGGSTLAGERLAGLARAVSWGLLREKRRSHLHPADLRQKVRGWQSLTPLKLQVRILPRLGKFPGNKLNVSAVK